ncbi:MAG: AMP-binding protein [Myxococcaceae bacterium]
MHPSPVLARWQQHAGSTRTAIVDAEGAHSWEELDARSRVLAEALLIARPTLAGQRVALLVEPGATFVASLFAVFRAGGCAVILSPLHPAAESAYFLQDARVMTVLVSEKYLDKLPTPSPNTRIFPVEALLRHAPPPSPDHLPQVLASDAALQVYTSGTTGKPKGAVLTHGNLGAQQEALGAAWGMNENDVLLHLLPLHHVHGLSIALLSVLGAGGSARMLAGFDAARVWEELGQSTLFMAVPTIYSKLLAAWDAADASTREGWSSHARALRLSTSGSAALPVSVGDRWRELTGAFPLERYGMTEIGVALSNPVESTQRRPGTVGRPLRGVGIRIVDEAGADAPSGELWVSGPSVFPGYFQREAETQNAFVTHEGTRYFRTGDTVNKEEDGSIRILGRTSVDILKSGGYKLSALELEELFRENPAVGEVAVVGVPDEVWGDRVVACIVPRPGSEAACAEEALRAWLKERVAAYKVPRHVLTFTELPRNAMGKVVKPELTKVAAQRLTAET